MTIFICQNNYITNSVQLDNFQYAIFIRNFLPDFFAQQYCPVEFPIKFFNENWQNLVPKSMNFYYVDKKVDGK